MIRSVAPADDGAESVLTAEADRASHLNEMLLRLPRAELLPMLGATRATATERGLWSELEGRRSDVPLALRPRLLDLSCRGYVHHVTWQIRAGLRRLARMLESHPQVQQLLPLEPVEREWIDRYRLADTPCGLGERVFCRLDALVRFDGPGWRSTLKFMETNVIGPAGLTYAPAAEAAVLSHLAPRLLSMDEELVLEPNHDPRELLWDELEEHAALCGCSPPIRVALLDDAGLYRLGGEMGRLQAAYRARGLETVTADPRELWLGSDGEVVLGGSRVDLIYRFLELRELAEMEAAGADLRALRRAFQLGRVIPSVAGDLEHKSAFEVLTRPDLSEAFSPNQRSVYAEHVLWTRLLFERRTSDPDGVEVDLCDYVLGHQQQLALKPNRSYGGHGVVLGKMVTGSEWEAALQRCLQQPGSAVVQQLAPLNCELFPVLGPAGLELRTFYLSSGFFPGRRGLGVFGRFSAGPVVNVHQQGGVVPFLVCVA